MPWKEQSATMKREEFVKRVISQENSKSALCREYGISRPSGDKWIARYEKGESLDDQSRVPIQAVNKTNPEMEKLLLEYRQSHPAIGAVKTKRIFKNNGVTNLPSASTVNAIFKRNGCITREASQAAAPCQRYEKATPNEME